MKRSPSSWQKITKGAFEDYVWDEEQCSLDDFLAAVKDDIETYIQQNPEEVKEEV